MDGSWIKDLAHGRVQNLLIEFLAMHTRITSATTITTEGIQDTIRWDTEESGLYSAKSAYNMQFQGRRRSNFDQVIWKTWAPGKIKMFS